MSVKLLTEHHLEFLSLKGGCTGSSQSTHVKMPHCWKSHALAHLTSRFLPIKTRIYHECEGRIEQSVPRIAVWHHEACRVMTNGDPEGRIFLFYPHMNNGFFFLLNTVFFIYLVIYVFKKKLPEVPEYAKMQFHMMTLLDVLG